MNNKYDQLVGKLAALDGEAALEALRVARGHRGCSVEVELADTLKLRILSDPAEGLGEDLYVGVTRCGRLDVWFLRDVRLPSILAAIAPNVTAHSWESHVEWPGDHQPSEMVSRTSRTADPELAEIVGDGSTSVRRAFQIRKRKRHRAQQAARNRRALAEQLAADQRWAEERNRAASRERADIERRTQAAFQRAREESEAGRRRSAPHSRPA